MIEKNIQRTGKITPTKPGHFVTCWKRNKKTNITEPFDINDDFENFIIKVENKQTSTKGIFTFPKQMLLKNKIITDISNNITKGKNGFRLYTPDLTNLNKTATKTQELQKIYYISIQNK